MEWISRAKMIGTGSNENAMHQAYVWFYYRRKWWKIQMTRRSSQRIEFCHVYRMLHLLESAAVTKTKNHTHIFMKHKNESQRNLLHMGTKERAYMSVMRVSNERTFCVYKHHSNISGWLSIFFSPTLQGYNINPKLLRHNFSAPLIQANINQITLKNPYLSQVLWECECPKY